MFKLSCNYRLTNIILRRCFIEKNGVKCCYSEVSGKDDGKGKDEEDKSKDDGDKKLDVIERPCENTHGTSVLGQKQTAHEKEYFYKEEQDQIKQLKKMIKEKGSLTPPDKDKKK